MWKIALAAASAVIFAGSAQAADLAVKAKPLPAPVFSWTGLYVGANAGGAWGDTAWTYDGPGSTHPSHHISGPLAGGTVGANWQFPATNWVIGVEGDFDWADISGSAGCGASGSCQSKISEFATVRGRLGYAAGRFLAYGTGGAAWGRTRLQFAYDKSGAPDVSSATDMRTGWAAGGGIEYAFWGPWSAKLEYLHFDLGSETVKVDVPVHSHEKGDLVRLGVDWKFLF